jgi:hypothetical protein
MMCLDGSADGTNGENSHEHPAAFAGGLQYLLPASAAIAGRFKASFIILVHISFSKTIWKHRHARWADPPDITPYYIRRRFRDGG